MMLFGNVWNNLGHDTKPAKSHDTKPATMALCKQIDLKLYLGYTESYPKARMELCKQIDFKRKSIFMKKSNMGAKFSKSKFKGQSGLRYELHSSVYYTFI